MKSCNENNNLNHLAFLKFQTKARCSSKERIVSTCSVFFRLSFFLKDSEWGWRFLGYVWKRKSGFSTSNMSLTVVGGSVVPELGEKQPAGHC